MHEEILTHPEVIKMVIGAIVAILGAVVALAAAAKRWADARFKPIASAVKATQQQTENNHGPDGKDVNLRDQIDDIQAEIRSGFRRMDHQFGEVHDRQTLTDARVEGIESRASTEHARIWKAIEGE